MNYQGIKRGSVNKFQSMDFNIGDIFSEMLSYWEVIIGKEGNQLTILSGSNDNLKLKKYTTQEFEYHCRYKSIDGYWIDFMKNDVNSVKRYIDSFIKQEKMTEQEIRDFKLSLINI